MTLPHNLIFIRHGESVGNVALNAAKKGDTSFFTEEFVNTPDRAWGLSDKGVEQARVAGDWLREEFHNTDILSWYSRHYVSPLVRTRQTAGNLDLRMEDQTSRPSVQWYLNRSIRERDWGEISTMPKADYRNHYPHSAHKERTDPLYWRPPGGESVADVAENRVRNFFDTLHRECGNTKAVFAVSHGEFIRAAHLMLTRSDDETYLEWEADDDMRIHNCEVFHYTRDVPEERFLVGFEKPGSKENNTCWPSRNRLTYFRRSYPKMSEVTGKWEMFVGEWEEITYELPDNDTLKNAN